MSIEGVFFEMAKDALESVFSGDHALGFADQSAVLDGAAEAAEGVIRDIEASPEEIGKIMATLLAMGATILFARFIGGRWKLRVRFG